MMDKKTENVRRIEEIVEELFKPIKGGSALERCARVRRTLYEIMLWRNNKEMPISQIPSPQKAYFCERFLEKGIVLSKASDQQIIDAIAKLQYAENACLNRCTRLVGELNASINEFNETHEKKLEGVSDIIGFINYYTFSYSVKLDHEGKPVMEKPYSFEVRFFHDGENRSDAWYVIKRIHAQGRIISMQNVYRLNKLMELNSVRA